MTTLIIDTDRFLRACRDATGLSYKPLRDIPNQVGLQIIVVNGDLVECEAVVSRGDSGSFYLRLPDGASWSKLIGWRNK